MISKTSSLPGDRQLRFGIATRERRTDAKSESMRYWIIPSLIFVALMKPSGFEAIPWMIPFDLMFTGIQIFSMIYALWLYLRQPISKMFVLLLMLYLLYALPVVLQEDFENLSGSDSLNLFKIIAAIMIVEAYVSQGYGRVLARGLVYGSLFLLAANLLITFVLNPGGLYNDFSNGVYGECFLGNKNTVRNPLLVGFACSLVLDALNRMRTSRRTIVLIVAGLINLALVWSATALVVFAAACALYFLSLIGVKIPSIKALGIAAAASWFVVVVFRRIDIFQHLVVDVLQKDMTFSGRTTMWDCAFDAISQSPFLGQGLGSYLAYWNVNNPFLQVPHCHNAFVDAMYKGGVLSIIILVTIIVIACARLQRIENRQIKVALTITIAAFLFMGIFGELLNPCFMSVLAIAACSNKLEETASRPGANY